MAFIVVGCLPVIAQTTEKMNRIDACKRNYRQLFGAEALTGQGTDPEMMDILQKFIFGEVFQTGNLKPTPVPHSMLEFLLKNCVR